MKPFWRSKKWWTAIIAALVPVADAAFGLHLDADQIAAIILPLVAYVLGESWADAAGASSKRRA